MHYRCYNPKFKQYADWGGRGITVCERWHLFENFHSDMGEPPSPQHSLERRNNDGNYEPENCYWATRKEQARNQRTNRKFTIGNETHCLAEWAERHGLSSVKVWDRLSRGWTIEESLDVIQRPRNIMPWSRWITANGETHRLTDWVQITDIKKSAIRSRLKRGWTPERALNLTKN